MKTQRQRVLLTAAAIAGSVALYGCGGGDSGPDKTPFNQTDLDRAAAQAEEQAEMRADAVAKAMAAAGRAASEAKKADGAAKAAAAAAAAAATAATTAGLSVDEAMKQKEMADSQSRMAAAAATAAAAAASDAAAQAARHMAAKEHSDAAMVSANTAKASADMAAASAMAAARSLATARSVKGDRDATGDLAAAAGVHTETAKQQAAAADKAAKAAMSEVAKAKGAATVDAADMARTAAMKALDAANTAYEAADAAADEAEGIESDAAAVTMQKTEARTHANAAKASRELAQRHAHYTAGYADARKAREQADAGKTDLASHKDFKDRVPWIAKATTSDANLDDEARRARDAAESMERSTITDVIAERRARIASALAMAEAQRSKAGADLSAAIKAYDAAKPFSENGGGIDNSDSKASGETLRHPNGKISVDLDTARLYPMDLEITEQGPYDELAVAAVRSYGGIYTAEGTTTPVLARYKMDHVGAQGVGPNLDRGGYYKHISVGIWGEARDGFNLTTPGNPDDVLTEVNSFVFADPSNLTRNIPATGSAVFQTIHRSWISVFTGIKGDGAQAGTLAVIDGGAIVPNTRVTGADTRFDGFLTGVGTATIDFAKGKVNLQLNNATGFSLPTNLGQMFYDIEGMDLDRSTGVLSGGTYVGQRSGTGARTREADYNHYSDPFRTGSGATGSSYVPTVKLHGGLFGTRSDEIGGTIRLTATVPHGVAAAADAAKAKDGTITVNSAFAGINSSIPIGN